MRSLSFNEIALVNGGTFPFCWVPVMYSGYKNYNERTTLALAALLNGLEEYAAYVNPVSGRSSYGVAILFFSDIVMSKVWYEIGKYISSENDISSS